MLNIKVPQQTEVIQCSGSSQLDGELTRQATRHLSLGHPPRALRVDGEEFVGDGARDKFLVTPGYWGVCDSFNMQTKCDDPVVVRRSSMES